MDKSNLSDEGREIYEETGYYELIIPYLHEDYEDPGVPYQFTIDFVLDEDLREKFEKFPYEDRNNFLTKSRLRELLNRGLVVQVYSGEPAVESVDELENELDKMQFF